jgi:hypothetical protein
MELYINNYKIDINERLPFPLTYNISDIKDLKSRKGNNSKTITLPGTKSNLFLFYNAFSLTVTRNISGTINSFDFDPTIKASARYYEQGILQFNGFCQLSDCEYSNGEWAINVLLFSDQIDYISRLSKIKVNELDWSEYNHDCLKSNQEDSWSGTIQVNGVPTSNKTGANWDGLGYYYGLIDYGFNRPSPDAFAVEHIAPQVFCYDILKKIFDYCGITWSSAFLESQTFKRMLMAYAGGDFPKITQAEADNLSSVNNELNRASGYIANVTIPQGPFQSIGGGLYESVYQPLSTYQDAWVNIVTDPSGQTTSEEPVKFEAATSGLYTIEYSGDHEVTLDFTTAGATLQYAFLNIALRLRIRKNGFIISEQNVYTMDYNGITSDNVQTISFNYTRQINASINDDITLEYRIFSSLSSSSSVVLNAIPSSFSTAFKIDNVNAEINFLKNPQSFGPGLSVNLSDFLPNMDGSTFLKGFVTAFNLYVKSSVDDPSILEIEPLNDFYDDASTALNWTDKLDLSKSIKVTPTINFASKEYLFSFEKDADYYNQNYLQDVGDQYGSFLVDSRNQFSKDTTEFKLPFAQKLLVNIPFDDTTFTNIIVPRSFQIRTDTDGSSSVSLQNGKPFLVQLGPMTTATWQYIDENGIATTEGSYPYVGHLNSLTSPTFDFNFGVPEYVYYQDAIYTTTNLFFYHEEFIKEIVSRFGKQKNCSINITPDMINQLDFKKLINIDGIVYRLQKVENWDSGKDQTTNVELIRIIKGEGLVGFDIELPFNPFIKSFARVTEGKFTTGSQPRITEDNITREIQ